MNILKIYMCRLAILAVLFALSIGMVAVANGEANVSSKTSSNVGTNMTSSISYRASITRRQICGLR